MKMYNNMYINIFKHYLSLKIAIWQIFKKLTDKINVVT